MNRKRIFLLAASALAVTAAIPLLNPQQLLAQVRAALVRDIDSPARMPVVLIGNSASLVEGITTINYDICSSVGCSSSVPSIYRLVIEHVGVYSPTSLSTLGGIVLQSTLHNHQVDTYLQPPDRSSVVWTNGTPVRIYVDSGSDVRVQFIFGGGDFNPNIHSNAYGYYVEKN
jgi:hypothetical protein